MTTTYSVPTLSDGNLRLRAPRMDDVAARIAAGNCAEIQHMYGAARGTFAPVIQKQAQGWLTYYLGREHSRLIDIGGALADTIFLHSLNHDDQRATLAMDLLRKEHLGQGYGTRALKLLVSHAFDVLGWHRIALRMIDDNTRALAAYKKVEFVEEGRERQSAKVGDRYFDDVMMGVLAQEYASMQGGGK